MGYTLKLETLFRGQNRSRQNNVDSDHTSSDKGHLTKVYSVCHPDNISILSKQKI